MTFDELMARKAEIVAAVAELREAEKEVDIKIEKARESKAAGIFENIKKELREMAELGYTISVLTDDSEWGGKNWHEIGMSFLALEMTDTDQQEAIFEALDR